MWGFSKKRFFITLGISITVWFVSTIVQAMINYNVSFSLFGSTCTITGFPIATCLYDSKGEVPAWGVALFNIFIWFWVIHLFWNWFDKRSLPPGK